MIARSWLLGSCILAVIHRVSAQQAYNISFSDQSPLITYSPSRIGLGTDDSFNISYSSSPWSSYQTGQYNYGFGDSSHWTTYSPAAVSFSFVGTAVYAWGNNTDGNAFFQIDGTQGPEPGFELSWGGSLAKAENLSMGLHQAVLYWKGAGGLNVTGFTVTAGVGPNGSTLTNSTMGVIGNLGNMSINSEFKVSPGDWTVAYEGPVDSTSTSTSFLHLFPNSFKITNVVPFVGVPTLEAYHPYATIGFQVPDNTAMLMVNGSVSPVSGPYSVSLSQTSGSSMPLNSSTPTGNNSYSHTSPWGRENEVLYFATLDPAQKYKVEMEYIGDTGGGLGVNDVYFVQVPSTTTSGAGSSSTSSSSNPSNSPGSDPPTGTKSHTGAIAGGIVAAVAALAIAGVLIWFLRRRKRRQLSAVSKPPPQHPFEVDDYREVPALEAARPIPFADNPQMAYADAAAGRTPLMREYTNEEKVVSGSSPNRQSTSSDPAQITIREATSSNSRTPPSSSGSDPTAVNTPLLATTSTPRQRERDQPKPPRRGRAPRGPVPTPRPVHDVDAGRLQGENVELLPPNYDPAWGRDREGEGE